MSVIDLKESSPNVWKAVCKSESGMFLTEIKIDGQRASRLFCSCPRESYGCSHVAMIHEAVRHHKLISEFEQQTNYQSDDYSQVLRTILDGLRIDFDAIDDMRIGGSECADIYVMDYLLYKANHYIVENKLDQAVQLCKICIDEYTAWMDLDKRRSTYRINIDYQYLPYEILHQILFIQEGKYVEDLFNYCKSEMVKITYTEDVLYNGYMNLFMLASAMIGSKDFVEFLDKLEEALGKGSRGAREIGDIKEDFYRYYNYYNNE